MANNPVIGLQFDYKKSLDAMFKELDRRFEEFSKAGKNFEFSDSVMKGVAELRDQFNNFVNETNETLSTLGKNITPEQFEIFSKQFEKKVTNLGNKVDSTTQEFDNMQKAIGSIEGGDAFKALTNGLKEMQQQVHASNANVNKLLKTVTSFGGVPQVDLFSDDQKTEAEEIQRNLAKISKVQEIMSKKRFAFYSAKNFETDKSKLKELDKIYTQFLSQLKDYNDIQNDINNTDPKNKEALNGLKISALNAGTELSLTALKVENLIGLIRQLDKTNDTNLFEKGFINGKDVVSMLSSVDNWISQNYKGIISDAKIFAEQFNGTLNTELFKLKDGYLTIPIRLESVEKTLEQQLATSIKALQTYAISNPVYVQLKSEFVSKKTNTKEATNQDVGKLSAWLQEYQSFIEKSNDILNVIESVKTNINDIKEPTNLLNIKNYLIEIAGLKTPDIVKDIKDFQFKGGTTQDLKYFYEAISTINQEAEKLIGTQKSADATKGLANLFNALAPFQNGFSKIDTSGLSNTVNAISEQVKQIDFKNFSSENVKELIKFSEDLKKVAENIPQDTSAFERLKTHVTNMNAIKPGEKLVDKATAIREFAKQIFFANQEMPDDFPKFAKVPQLNVFNELNIDGNKLSSMTQGLSEATFRIADAARYIGEGDKYVNTDLSDYKKLPEAINALGTITVDAKSIAEKLNGMVGVFYTLQAIAERILLVDSLGEYSPETITSISNVIKSVFELSKIKISGSEVVDKLKGLTEASGILGDVSANLIATKTFIDAGIPSLATLVSSINELKKLDIDPKDLLSKTNGLIGATKSLPGAAKNLSAFSESLPSKETSEKYGTFVEAVNKLKDINVSDSILEKIDKVKEATNRMKEISKKLPNNFNGFTNFTESIKSIKDLKINKSDIGIFDKADEIVNRLQRVSTEIPSTYPGIYSFVRALNSITNYDFEKMVVPLLNIDELVLKLKELSAGIPMDYPGFGAFINSISSINGIDFSKFFDTFDNVETVTRWLENMSKAIPVKYAGFDEFVYAVEGVNRIDFKTVLSNMNNVDNLVARIEKIAKGMPKDFKSFVDFVTAANALSKLDTGENVVQKLKDLKEVSGIMYYIKEMLPTDGFPSFKPFVDAIKPLSNKTASVPADIGTKFEGLKSLGSIIKGLKNKLPRDYSNITGLFTALGAIKGSSISKTDTANFSAMADALEKYRLLSIEDIKTENLLQLGEFLLLISDTKMSNGAVGNFAKLPGIFKEIVEHLKGIPEGTSKFYDFLTNVLSKKNELADLASIMKAGIENAKKAEAALNPNYDQIVANYREVLRLQKELYKINDPLKVDEVRYYMAGLLNRNEELLKSTNLTEKQKTVVDGLAQSWQIAKQEYQEYLNSTWQKEKDAYSKKAEKERELARIAQETADKEAKAAAEKQNADNYQKLINNYKEMIRLQTSVGKGGSSLDAFRINILQKQNEELLKSINLTEEQVKEVEKLNASYKDTKDAYYQSVSDDINKKRQAALDGANKAYSELIKKVNEYYNASKKLSTGKDKNLQQDILARNNAYAEMVKAEELVNSYGRMGLLTEKQLADLADYRKVKEEDVLKLKADTLNSLTSEYDKYKGLTNQSDNFKQSVKEAGALIETINNLLSQKNKNGILSPEVLMAIEDALAKLGFTVNNLSHSRVLTLDRGIFNKDDLINYIHGLNGVDESTIKVDQSGKILTGTYQNLKGDMVSIKLEAGELGQAFNYVGTTINRSGGLVSSMNALGEIFRSFTTYLSAAMLVRKFWSKLREGFDVVKEIDKQFTEMRKVSDETIMSLKNYVDESYEVAKATGSTSTSILSSTADYMRLGKSLSEAAELAKNTTILMNISEFDNVNDATDALIAMAQAYQELDSIDIIDKLNKIGNEFAISTSDLAQSLQRSAGTLKVAGNDLNEAIALTTAGNAILQDPLKVGAGLRTISLRITGTAAAKKELEELGEDVDDFVVTTTSKLNEKVKGLTKTAISEAGVSLLDAQGNYRSTYEILQDIADVWKTIKEEDVITGENRQNALLELLAGKNRSNILASILDDADLLRDVYTRVQDSANSAMKEQEKYMESLEGRINVLTTASQEFWYSFLNSDLLKNVVSAITEIIKLLDKFTETLGSVPTVLVGLSAILGPKMNFVKIFQDLLEINKLRRAGKALAEMSDAGAKLAGNINKAKIALGGFLSNLATVVLIAGAIKIISSAIDKYYYSTEEIATDIEKQERKLEEINSEYDKLNEKRKDGTITAAEHTRIHQLENEKRLIQEQIGLLQEREAAAKYEDNNPLAMFDEGTYRNKIKSFNSKIGVLQSVGSDYDYFTEKGKDLPAGLMDNLESALAALEDEKVEIASAITDIENDLASGLLSEEDQAKANEYLDKYTEAAKDIIKYSDIVARNQAQEYGDNYKEAFVENLKEYSSMIISMSKLTDNGRLSFDFINEFPDLWQHAKLFGMSLTDIEVALGLVEETSSEAEGSVDRLVDTFTSINTEAKASINNISEIAETFDKVTSSVTSLRDAQLKLKKDELTKSDVLQLVKDYPRLASDVDWNDINFGNLNEAISTEIDRVINTEITALEDRQKILKDLIYPTEISKELRSLYEDYEAILNEVNEKSIDAQRKYFGNVYLGEKVGAKAEYRKIKVGEQEIELAITPTFIKDGKVEEFSEEALEDYINDIIGVAAKDGIIDATELSDIDKLFYNVLVDVGDAAEETAEKFNVASKFQLAYSKLLEACGGDYEALSQLSQFLGVSIEDLTIEYEKNESWLNFLRGSMEESGKTLSELRTEYDDTTSKIGTLDDAISKLLSKEMTDADVLDLMREFKELAQFDDIDLNDKVNFGNLLQHLMELRNTLPTPLIEALKKLREELAMTASPETLAEIDTLITGLQRAVTFDETGDDAWTQAITDSFSKTNDVVESTLSYLDNLVKLQEAVADGFAMDAEKAWELAQMFPELSAGIEEYGDVGDGMVKLNEDIVNGILEGTDTTIDAQITQLEADKAVLQAKADYAKAVLEIAQQAANGEGELSKEEAVYKIENMQKVLDASVDANIAQDEAYATATQDMIDNTDLLETKVSDASGTMKQNLNNASSSAATNYANAQSSMQANTDNTIDNVHNLAQAIKAAAKGEISGGKVGSRTQSIAVTDSGTGNKSAKLTTVSNLSKTKLDTQLDSIIAKYQADLSSYLSGISAIDGQITTLRNLQGNMKDRIKKGASSSGSGGSGGGGGGGGGGEGSDAAEEQFSETFDWIERAIEMIQKAVERLSKAAGDVYIKFSKRNKALLAEMDKVREEIALQQEAYITYMSIAESVELSEEYKSKVREGLLQIEEVEDEELAKKINLYKEWYDKATQCKDAIQDLEINLGELAKQKFDNVSKEFEDAMSFIEHRANMVNKAMDKASERGFITSVQYYQALTRYENENLTNLKDKREALIEALADGVKSGAVEEGSEAWYEMQNSINSVTEAIEDSEKALISYDNSIRDVYWDIFDRTRTTVAEVTEEVEFLMGLLDNNPMFNGGDITKEGQAAYGLHAVNYQVYMEEAEAYAKEIQEINRQLATDPYDTVLIDRRKELIKLQRDMINNAEDEKEAMKKLTEDGIKSFLDAMKESIDAYKELMSDWKDDYTFQKNIDEQTEAIARLQKQLNAYSGDDSESGRLNSQKTMNSLRDAQEKLQEDQRDHYISETEKILDNLYDEAESALNERLDHFEELLTTIFDGINANADTIGDTLRETVAEVNTSLSETMDEIWDKNSAASTAVTDAIAKYGEKVGTLPNNVTDSISTIEKYVKALLKAADATAAAELQKQEEDAKKTTVTTAVANQKSKVAANTSNHNVNTAVATGTKAKMTNTAVSSSGGSSSASASGSGTNSTSSSGGKGGDFFVYKKYADKSNLNLAQSIVDRLRYNDIDNSFENRAKYYEGMGFGAASTYYGTYEQNVKMLSWMKSHGYRKGLIKSNRNHWAMTQEDGLEVINSPKLGMLTPIGKGDTVFTADQTKALWTLSKDFANRVSKPDYNSGNASTNNVFNLNIGIERVQDYNDFLRQLQNDNRFEKLVKACSIDQLNGANRVSKRRINI